jgi:sugar lactone lactonase YvrE/mono/diheme cytochrome c family protein
MDSLFDHLGNSRLRMFVYLRGVRSICDDFGFIVLPPGSATRRPVPPSCDQTSGERTACEMRPYLRRLAWVLALPAVPLLLSACGGGGHTVSSSGNGGTGGPPATTATLAQIQEQIFTPYCVSCHTTGGLGPMSLADEGTSYAALVNVTPLNGVAKSAGLKLVVPGDPSKSFLLDKLTGDNWQIGMGDRMPQGGNLLSAKQIQLVRNWILAGAPQTGSGGGTGGGGTGAAGTITTLAGETYPGYNGDGKPLSQTQLYWPQDVVIDPTGALYVADWNNHRIRKADTPTSPVSTVFGQSKLGYDPVNHPCSVTLDPQGQVIVAAWHNFSIYRIHPGMPPELVAGNRTQGLSGDGGPATKAQCDFPSSAAFDAAGNMYVSDQGNRRIRKVDTQGIITTYAGRGNRDIVGFAGDGGPATDALFDCDRASDAIPGFKLDIDPQLNKLYICDTNNNRVRVIDLGTGIINTLAGNGNAAFAGDGGPATAASLSYPTDVCVASDHSVYIADAHNEVVRRVDPQGIITTVAGTPGQKGFSGDGGPATSAKFNLPEGIYVDRSGNLYVADVLNNRIRMVRAR